MTLKQQHKMSIIKGFAVGIIVELLPFIISYLTTNQGTFEAKGFYTAIAAVTKALSAEFLKSIPLEANFTFAPDVPPT